MLILFFDSKSVIHHEYVPECQTVNVTFYVQVLKHFCKRIACVGPEMWRNQKFFLLHSNAYPYTATIVQQFLAKKEDTVELSLIFARFKPPWLFRFPKLKLELNGDHYASIEHIQKSVTTKLKAFSISDFALEDRVNQCIRVSGDYFK